jgi:putative heme degradation protein
MCFGDKLKKPAVDGSTTGLKKFNDAIRFYGGKTPSPAERIPWKYSNRFLRRRVKFN